MHIHAFDMPFGGKLTAGHAGAAGASGAENQPPLGQRLRDIDEPLPEIEEAVEPHKG